jgi:hypothetical protein
MSVYQTKFDGKEIAVPPELQGKPPCVVTLLVPGGKEGVFFDESRKGTHSIWDVVARAKGTRSAEDIDAGLRADRDGWDDE